MNAFASFWIDSGNVALNMSVWRSCFGGMSRSSTSFLICGSKPMSSMRSASSRIKRFVLDRETTPRSTKSCNRPGVATSMSHPLASSRSCALASAPPYTTTARSGGAAARVSSSNASRRASWWIWIASSRVGAMTTTEGEAARLFLLNPSRAPGSSFEMAGTKNAHVFPDPVCAHDMRSFASSSASGRQCA